MRTREEIEKRLKDFFEEKANKYGIEMVFLYGSWARGFPKEDSDVDIAVFFEEDACTDDELFDRITDISFSLSKTISTEVNTIPIRHDFRQPMLYYNAIVLGIPVFIKEFDKYIAIKNVALFQMEDFILFGIDWQLTIAKKNLEEMEHA